MTRWTWNTSISKIVLAFMTLEVSYQALFRQETIVIKIYYAKKRSNFTISCFPSRSSEVRLAEEKAVQSWTGLYFYLRLEVQLEPLKPASEESLHHQEGTLENTVPIALYFQNQIPSVLLSVPPDATSPAVRSKTHSPRSPCNSGRDNMEEGFRPRIHSHGRVRSPGASQERSPRQWSNQKCRLEKGVRI